MKRISILFLSLFVLAACSKDNDSDNATDKDAAKEITAFTFLASDNEALSQDVKATIDKGTKTVTAEVPVGTDVKALKPTIALSEKATVDPKDKTSRDFSEEVTYTVTAEDGSTNKYTVTVIIGKSSAKAITGFKFLAADNDGLSNDVDAVVDEEAKTISATLPFGVNLSALVPALTLSEGASSAPVNKTVTDFTKMVTFMVTAEDQSNVGYTVTITLEKPTDREVLVMLYNANPDNTLGWDLEEENIANWTGVQLRNGSVSELNLISKNIENLTKNIGSLVNLVQLQLNGNPLKVVPAEIGNLTKLRTLDLQRTSLENVPTSIGDLKNLTRLDLGYNSLIAIPSEIGGLTKIEELYLSNNDLATISSELGKLTTLKKLSLFDNDLASLPRSMGNLTNLVSLFIQNNQITTIPKEICELNIPTFSTDPDVTCEQ
ncbi:DUF5018 domain-containing protein [Flagellimonas sp. 389]|uniref:leucine-rich repeat domain-containing protein n=1 Tax=Flagellimonas sp. 389 TaxID=2835862 RepID=UPI001BD3A755|nr:DUF5018 domain-containing protein [Flagellimonas sp. 389]MBS9463378.1 DUF5018 domain-containing protein [Flagellimonas sp. 389]